MFSLMTPKFRHVLALAALAAVAAATSPAFAAACGGHGERACKATDRGPQCDSGLRKVGSSIMAICIDPSHGSSAHDPTENPAYQPPGIFPLPGPPVYYNPPTAAKKGTLPHLSTIAPTQPSAMDGIWQLAANGIPYQIEAGRLYAMAEYAHLGIFPVEAQDVVVKNIVQAGPGRLIGYDMALVGNWSATLLPNGTISVSTTGILGPFSSSMTPIQIDNQEWLNQELATLSGGGMAFPDPGGVPYPAPAPVDAPGDDGSPYPPEWGD